MTGSPLEIWCDWYEQNDISYFPLYGVMNGICRCIDGKNCKSPGKHPRKKAWSESVGEMPGPLDNIGISTNNLVVIDVDDVHIPLEQFGTTFTTSTGRGFHIWYKANPDKKVKTCAGWKPHVDIRAIGGLVVAPPSKYYLGGYYEPINEEPIRMIPDDLLELMPEKSEGERLGHAVTIHTSETPQWVMPTLMSACERVVRAPNGQRNAELFRQFCAILRYVDSSMMGSDAIEALKESAMIVGLTRDEIETTLKSAKNTV